MMWGNARSGRWTTVDKAKMRVMVRNGRTVREISLALERSMSSVRYGIRNYGPEKRKR